MRQFGFFTLVVALYVSPAEAAIIATKTSSNVANGISLIRGRTRAPASNFYATVVSLCQNGIGVKATESPSGLRTTSGWAASAGVKAAVNGDFFKADPRVYGLAVGNGNVWPVTKTGLDPAVAGEWYYDRYGWIAFGPGFVEFSHTGWVKTHPALFTAPSGFEPSAISHTYPKGTLSLVSGFPELVTEGKRMTCPDPAVAPCFADRSDMRARNPRTAMGLSQDRRTFILAVVDGRSSTSAGMYGTELAELMEELGAWQAFNLDGGGSSEMWISGSGTVNRPSDGSPRAVANHWGIVAGAGAATSCQPIAAPDAGPVVAESIDGSAPPTVGAISTEVPEDPSDTPVGEVPDGSGCAAAPLPTMASLSSLVAVALTIAMRLVRLRKKRAKRFLD